MDRLNFGARARRRARIKRLARWATYASIAAVLLGVPGSLVAVRTLNSLTGSTPGSVTTAGGIETPESTASALRFKRHLFKIRPTPTPSTPPQPDRAAAPEPPASGGSVTEIVSAAAAEYGLDADYLLSVASCESGLDPSAVNPAGYHGLFQFDEQTWAAYGYGSIYDPVAQARTAAELLAAGHHSRWPNCA
ncbi:MAG: transglycosylase family protein [Actinomycetota bacterium]